MGFYDAKNMKKVPFKFLQFKAHEIRAQVPYAGLCQSDAHTVLGDWGECKYPIAPGHEIVGRVTNVGSQVKGFKIGDRVGFDCQRECCEKCEFCKANFGQLCVNHKEQNFIYDPLYWGGYATAIQHPQDFFF